MIVENICKVFYIKKVNLISGVLRISLIFYIFAPLKKGNDMAEIANRIYETSEGQILFISDFSDINDNEKVVSRALSVEEKKGNIVRLANGVYLRPKNTRFGIVYPSIDEMVMAIAQRDKVQIQPSGVTALNKLGLSTQVPTKYTYLTSGSGRVLTLGNRTIVLKRSVPKNFAFKTVLAALLVQALRTLGQKNVGNQELSIIRKLVNEEEHKDLFVQDLTLMPVWMRRLITDIIDKNEHYDTLVKSHNR
ncbi:DUF6088 family protein [Segatella hominis]|nr:DUF6088 family protein [Segatella hominis]